MTERLAFRCKGCREFDTIVEISLVPRIFGVEPDGKGGVDYDEGTDEAFWESDHVIGYGCTNDKCPDWQGQWPGYAKHNDDGTMTVRLAPDLETIAEVAQA